MGKYHIVAQGKQKDFLKRKQQKTCIQSILETPKLKNSKQPTNKILKNRQKAAVETFHKVMWSYVKSP